MANLKFDPSCMTWLAAALNKIGKILRKSGILCKSQHEH